MAFAFATRHGVQYTGLKNARTKLDAAIGGILYCTGADAAGTAERILILRIASKRFHKDQGDDEQEDEENENADADPGPPR